jgi:catechol 2,3-dioxygenase-like lactoylglutathione lyase family enzyme
MVAAMATPTLAGIDHLVLTVADLDRSEAFYVQGLGMTAVRFGGGRRAVAAGPFKINLHPAAAPIAPHALRPGPGTADVCFFTTVPLADWQAHLAAAGIAVIEGPVPRTGAIGPLRSLYCRDPDGNLIEIAERVG